MRYARVRMQKSMRNMVPEAKLHERTVARKADIRGDYFRDTTAILHSYPFRRLKNKTQVFFAPRNDHICTRIEHVFHVASIASAICKGLGLDSDLAWAIGLGHDLGHPPFGHTGEEVLDELLSDRGGFRHEMNSLRVADILTGYGEGLNLTYAVRDGIVSHCGESFEQTITPRTTAPALEEVSDRVLVPCTYEGSVVRFADKIAYLGRDIEDALQLKVIAPDEIPPQASSVLGSTNRDIISNLVHDVIRSSQGEQSVSCSDASFEALLALKEFNYRRIYTSPLLTGYHNYFHRVLKLLFSYLGEIFERYAYDKVAYKEERNLLAVRFGDYLDKMHACYTERNESANQIVLDYVAGMTDTYALQSANEVLNPKRMHEEFDRFILEGE